MQSFPQPEGQSTNGPRYLAAALRYQRPAYFALAVMLGALHSYYFLSVNLSQFSALTQPLGVARTPLWSELLETTRSTASGFVLVGSVASVSGLWLVKVCILRFLGLLFDAPLDLRQSATIVTRSVLPFIVFSAVALVILWVYRPTGSIGWVSQSDVATAFSDAMAKYFSSVDSELPMRLINALRISSELSGAVIIFLLLDHPKIMSWRKAIAAASVLAIVVNLLSIVKLIRSVL